MTNGTNGTNEANETNTIADSNDAAGGRPVIKFGTDGWRAVVGKDFNFENVEIVTRAIAGYILEKDGIDKKIIIGYDPRNKAKEFAHFSASVLQKAGFKVFVSDGVVPTPVLAYNAKALDADALMFTASHNPPEYLGIKFIPDYAGPATTEITNAIVENIHNIDDISFAPEKVFDIEYKSFKESYFKHIESIIDFEKIKEYFTREDDDGEIIYDALYSASIGYFDELLRRNEISFETLHMHHDPDFGGGMPEPKAKYLQELIELISHRTSAIGLSNDGDGDRFGVINEKAEYVTPNEIIALLLGHLIKNKGYTGKLVKTVGASQMLDIIAQKYDIDVVETPVGFKWVGAAMREYDTIIGGEESGGLSIKGHIPEKDGILADLLVLEMLAYEDKPMWELQEELRQDAGCSFINERIDVKLQDNTQLEILMKKYSSLDEIAGFNVLEKDTKDGVKYYLDDNKTWVLIRPSGTEPLLRIYFESDAKDKIDELKEFFK